MDPTRINLGKDFTEQLEAAGVHVSLTAAAAHWQLGKTEVHVGLFTCVLERILTDRNPQNQDESLQCVAQCHVKNARLMVFRPVN